MGITPEQKKRNRRDICIAVIILAATFYPVNIIHEAGHAMICSLEGYTPIMKIDGVFGSSSVSCEGIQQGNILLYRLSGGLLTSAVFAAPALFFKQRFITISFIPIGMAQLVNGILEGFAFPIYITNYLGIPTILVMGTLFVAMLHFMNKQGLIVLAKKAQNDRK